MVSVVCLGLVWTCGLSTLCGALLVSRDTIE